MSARTVVLALSLIILATDSAASEPGPAPREIRFDQNGYPLPAGAVARLGEPWPLGENATDMAWMADGKRIVVVGWGTIATIDADTGRVVGRENIDKVEPRGTALLSRDGRILVRANDRQGWLNEISSGELFQTIRLPQLPGDAGTPRPFNRVMSLTADGRFLAGVTVPRDTSGSAWRFDLAKGTPLRLGERTDVCDVLLAPDGRRAFGSARGTEDALICWDLPAGRERWSVPLAGEMSLRAVSGDGRRVAVIGEKKVQVFDVDGPKLLLTAPHDPKWQDHLGSVALSPDGRLLALVDPKEVVVREVTGGKIRFQFPHPADLVSFAPDGQSLVTVSRSIQRWDLTTGLPKYPEPRNGHADLRADFLRWSGDGSRLLAGWVTDDQFSSKRSTQTTLEVWDTSAKSLRWRQPIPSSPLDVAFDKTGKTVRACLPDDRLRMWTINETKTTETNIELRRRPAEKGIFTAQFDPADRLVTVNLAEREMIGDTYDPAGKHLRQTTAPYRDLIPQLDPWHQYSHIPGQPGVVFGPLVRRDEPPPPARPDSPPARPDSPPTRPNPFAKKPWDGLRLVMEFPRTDLGDGRLLPPLQDTNVLQMLLRDSPVTGGAGLVGVRLRPSTHEQTGDISGIVWDVLTGRTVCSMPRAADSLSGLVLSPDGRWVAGHEKGSIVIYELRREMKTPDPGHMVTTFAAPAPSKLAFSPDGRQLASAHPDGSILIWEVPRRTPAPWVAAEADRLWPDLATTDAPHAWRTLWRLLDHPDQAAELLKTRLRLTLDRGNTLRQITRLDHPEFAVREAAARELAACGDAVGEELRTAFRKPVSVEQKERLAQLVSKLDVTPPPTSLALRGLRSVWLLERLGTPAARRHLAEIAAGAPDSPLTAEATAALARMSK
ncbi:WD40 repeat domain-containing protein [Zavarzinella formosa]|uniref:WD40 repeat domain-containing protein n=1 Tax=Zavarzinella formosa TaxID=360055 RepID=UPI00037D2992|nr:WD40 repeat domain-containing protein [Zavarzinella formosa]